LKLGADRLRSKKGEARGMGARCTAPKEVLGGGSLTPRRGNKLVPDIDREETLAGPEWGTGLIGQRSSQDHGRKPDIASRGNNAASGAGAIDGKNVQRRRKKSIDRRCKLERSRDRLEKGKGSREQFQMNSERPSKTLRDKTAPPKPNPNDSMGPVTAFQ